MIHLARAICVMIATLGSLAGVYAQERNSQVKERNSQTKELYLSVFVTSKDGEPVPGIVLCSKGKGSPSHKTDHTGRTQVELPSGTKSGDPVYLILVSDVQSNRGWYIVGSGRVQVHSFDNPNDFSELTLERRYSQTNTTDNGPSSQISESPARIAPTKESVDQLKDHLVEKETNFFQLLLYNAQILYKLELYPDAVKEYKKALGKKPDSPQVLLGLGLSFIKIERYEDANMVFEHCDRVLSISAPVNHADIVVVLESWAHVLRIMNKIAEAEEKQARINKIRASQLQRGQK